MSGGPSAALRTGWWPSGPLQKVSADPYFYRTSFPPLFPTLRTRRSGAVLRPRTWCRAARVPLSGTDRRAPNLCKKCRQTPIFIVPVFPHFGPKRLQGRLRTVFCLGRHSGYHPRFITPCKDTSSTRSRAAAPASGPRRALRAALGDAAAPFRWRTGSMDGGGSRRSLVGTSRLVTPCRGWRRSSKRMRSLHSSCAPWADGLTHTRWPSTTGPYRPAPPGRRVVLRAGRRR